LIYLYATQPRFDEASFAAVKTQWVTDLRNRLLDPINVLSDATNRAVYGDNLRYRTPTVADIESIDPQRAYEIYQERFADMDDFTFVFVGNFDTETLTALAQQYLGALPGQPTSETYVDHSPPFPTGIIEEVVYAGQEEQSIVQLIFTGPADASDANQRQLGALRRVLDLMTTRTLREELGGTYGTYVGASMSVEPTGRYMFVVQFGCDPQKVDEMVAALLALLVDLQENGPTESDVNTVNQQIARTLEVSLEQNDWWLGQIDYFSTTPGRSLEGLGQYVEAPFTVTAEDIQATAVTYLTLDNYLEIVLYPAAYQE
jgi:zinc protease